MSESLRIAVADDELDMRDFYRKVLPLYEHKVVVTAETGLELVEGCRRERPDLVITDIEMPELDGLGAIRKICADRPLPVILVSVHNRPELVERAKREHVLAYMVKPIKMGDLQPAVALAMQRFTEFRALQREAEDLRQALQDRKIIERAKGILMKRAALDEPEAFHRLQKMSREKKQRMVELAQSIVDAEEAFAS